MVTEKLAIHRKVLHALMERMYEEQWPVGIEVSLPFSSENEEVMSEVTVHYADDFPMGEKISETINQVFNLKEENYDSTRTN